MYKRYQLQNGIRVVTEKIPYFRSVSIGVWFMAGALYEDRDKSGIPHFIEHMLFKGTKNRTAKQIAQAMDAVGGQLNAFTAKECTCYYSNVIDEHLPTAVDVLSDMVINSLLDPVEMDKEKGVVLEEILMYEDSPEDLVHDLLAEALVGTHPLANSILGDQRFIIDLTRERLVSFLEEKYLPQNMVISVAGNFDEQQLVDLLEKFFGDWKRDSGCGVKQCGVPLPIYQCRNLFKWKDIEQVHMCIGYPGIPLGQDDVYPLMIFNNLFGGGMSSRLFQNIREDKGLVYSVMSYPSFYTCGGLFTIYASMKPSQARKVADLIMEEINRVKKEGISYDEFNTAKQQLKGNYILGLESSSSRMNAIGKSELLLGVVRTPEEILEKIENVTMDDVMRVLEQVLSPDTIAIAVVGRENVLEGIIPKGT
ncbi:putative Zn-dependent peptidase [Caldicoprobacter guelmensis]|uniref:M16 family metallopeptidase n=1 Tax=Caldicoprobacter guelmensis TaxID=1170224 RepID=UPI00195903E7|nr:pitrilysin family protein [Caldicoprobacter guelmensis]MBM7581434.1 putative Zn-dependent peptidase [Caldicoprobacter guelmensis]